MMRQVRKSRFKELRQPVIFGIFVLFASWIESEPSIIKEVDFVKKFDSGFYNFLHYVLSSRYVKKGQRGLQKYLDRIKFSQEQQVIIWKWIKQEISFRSPNKPDDEIY